MYPGRTEKLREREETIRETWVQVMETRIVREKLQKCHRVEGVNHYENCKELADRYLELLRVTKVSFDLG